jgi:ethanolamine transporter EutH
MADTRPWHGCRVPAESRVSLSRTVDRFHKFCEAVVSRLPFGLGSVIAPTFLGFCLINGLTFSIDLALLTTLRSGLGLAVPIAVTVAYACAFGLSYVLNRTFNFQSHGAVGPQLVVGLRSAIPAVANRGGHVRSGVHVQRDAMGGLPPLTVGTLRGIAA